MDNPRLSICFVTRKWAPAIGGMETYSHRLSEELSKYADVDVVALPGRENGSPPSALRLALFPFTFLNRWFRQKVTPDILHIGDMSLWPLGLLAVLSRDRPAIVLSAHGTDVSYHRRGGFRGSLYGGYLKLGSILLSGAGVIANSRATQEAAEESGWTVSRVVPLATDLQGRGYYHRNNGRLLFVGRLIPLKGFSWFAREVLPKLPDTLLLDVAGTIWNEEEGKALEHPRVNYLGALSQTQLCKAYSQALCVVMPNIKLPTGEYEGFGLVGPEAAVCGGVVIASRCDGLMDSVIDGETGILVEPGDAEAWAMVIRAVSEWCDAERKNFIVRAISTARKDFAWDRVASETCAVYRSELAR